MFATTQPTQKQKAESAARKKEKTEGIKQTKEQAQKATNEQQIAQNVQKSKENRNIAFGEGVEKGKKFFAERPSGLDPKERQSMQYEAQRQIQRQTQGAERKLLGEQGRRGILGKSGVAYQQHRDLGRIGQEAENQSLRDIEKLDSDLGMKQLAANFAIGQGEAGQQQLDYQLQEDKLRMEEDRKRQRALEDLLYNNYSQMTRA